MILGELSPDAGEVHQRKALRIGYLPQEPVFGGEKTVLEELHTSAAEILDLQKKLHDSAETLSGLSGGELKSAMQQYDRLSSEFEITGGYRYETKIKEIAAGLGLEEKHYSLKTTQLSGGQLSRLGLAKVLLADSHQQRHICSVNIVKLFSFSLARKNVLYGQQSKQQSNNACRHHCTNCTINSKPNPDKDN